VSLNISKVYMDAGLSSPYVVCINALYLVSENAVAKLWGWSQVFW